MIEATDGAGRLSTRRKPAAPGVHLIEGEDAPGSRRACDGAMSMLPRRRAIERHHTVTHLLHWALHEIVSREAVQKGSYVGPEKLTFDFSSAALTPQQKRDVEKLVNEKIAENAPVSWTEIPYAEAKKRSDIQQFFGDKYGDDGARGADRRRTGAAERLLDGALRRNACARDGRHRVVPDRQRRSDRGGHSANRSGGGRCGSRLGEAGSRDDNRKSLKRWRGRKRESRRCPHSRMTRRPSAMLEQIDARSAHLEKLEAEVHEWEKQHAKASEADLRSRAGIIANELAAAHAGEKSCRGGGAGGRRQAASSSRGCAQAEVQRSDLSRGGNGGTRGVDCVRPERTHVQGSGEQIDSGSRADRGRQRRRAAGGRAGRGKRREQDRRGVGSGARADFIVAAPVTRA